MSNLASHFKHLSIYQFGNFVLSHISLEQIENIGIKTLIDDNPFIHGRIKTNQSNQDKKDDTTYEVKLQLSENQDVHQFKKFLVYSKPEKIFFLEKVKTKIIQDTEIDYRVYYNYGHIIGVSPIEKLNQLRVVIRLMTPYKHLIEDNSLRFIKFSEQKNQNQWGGVYTGDWGLDDYGNWSDDYSSQEQYYFNNITPKQRGELIDCCSPTGFFVYEDIFYRHERMISPTTDKIQTINLTGAQGQESIYVSALTLNQQTTANNKIMIFSLQKTSGPALEQNEQIVISNTSTGGTMSITNLGGNCPETLLILPYRQNYLFNEMFTPVNYIANGSFKINIEREGLYLQGFYPYDYKDSLAITRNFSGDLTIKVLVLPTFH